MATKKGRQRMEKRFGELGTGQETLKIAGQEYELWDIMRALGLATEGIVQPVDAFHLEEEDIYAIRFFDGLARTMVAYEFDADFRYKRELRVHLAEYIGEDAYFDFPWNMSCPWSI